MNNKPQIDCSWSNFNQNIIKHQTLHLLKILVAAGTDNMVLAMCKVPCNMHYISGQQQHPRSLNDIFCSPLQSMDSMTVIEQERVQIRPRGYKTFFHAQPS